MLTYYHEVVMNHKDYKSYLKHQYLDQVRPLQSVYSVISAFQNKMDIVETTLANGDEIFLKMTSLNYVNKFNIKPEKLKFITFVVIKNEKSKHYYDEMDTAKIIIIIEPQLNQISSNSNKLKVDLRIELGIDESHIKEETTDFFTYLMFFDNR